MEPTSNQKEAIKVRDGNCLVSASAGSGKTSVLTSRVLQIILEGTKLEELLVLTFTKLAAAEMKERIRQNLIKLGDEKSIKIASCLDATNIQTYDAFALELVKKYYYAINLSKDVSLVDQTILDLEKHKMIEIILNEHFDKNDEKVLKLIDEYCLKNSNNLKDFIIRISNKFDLKEDKEEFIDEYISTYFNEKFVRKNAEIFVSNITKKIGKFIERIKKFENVKYAEVIVEILERIASCNNYDDLKRALQSEENIFPKCSGEYSLSDYPDDKLFNDYFKKQINSFKSSLVFESLDEMIKNYLDNKENTETIISLVKELDLRINEFKKKHNVYSYADIFKFALKIVSFPSINQELKNKFKYIMIDEYQDTSDLQEKFINKISNNNVYVVGDVKQSIYRFRNANCDLFLDKFNNYGKGCGGRRIELPENFRSRKEVVDAVNKVFMPIMTRINTGLDYKNEHMMIHGNKSFISANSDYSCQILEYELGNKYLINEHEARLIATDIAKKYREHFEVFDKEKKTLRPCKYSDFAILIFSKNDFELYQKIFNEYQIPLYADCDKSIRANNLTMAFENIVSLLYLYSVEDSNNHSNKYIHSFVSILRSFLFEIKDPDIADFLYKKNFDDFELNKIIQKIYKETLGLNLKEKISSIIQNFDIYNKLIRIGDVNVNISLLEYFYSIASQMDNMAYSLEDFYNYFKDLDEFDIDPEYSPNDDIGDCVQLLTIHGSKGLEFSICYYAQLYKRFNAKSITSKMLVDSEYGIDIPNVNSKQVSTFYHNLIKEKESREQLLEQLRVFYVALTRAKEKIIMLSKVDDRKNPLQEFSQVNHFFDFVMLSNQNFPVYSEDIEIIKKKISFKDDGKIISIHSPINLSEKLVENKHASKQLDDGVDDTLLLLGKKYHYYLEMVDFSTLDVSFIKDESDKKRLSKFLSNNIFKEIKNANVMHEYPFFDEDDNVNGVIDLLVEYNDHIDIIDFKLSHVDDLSYEKQVQIYKNYVSKITNKKINTYITGIFSGDIKKVD